VAFTTMGTGLLLICARKKAITQVLGFLVLENGISLFGAGILLEYGIVVELGILLDVFALVFILGIAIFQINRTFASTDTDQLNHLGDTHLMHPHHKHDHVHD
jgi:hydrogenase-4 component E